MKLDQRYIIHFENDLEMTSIIEALRKKNIPFEKNGDAIELFGNTASDEVLKAVKTELEIKAPHFQYPTGMTGDEIIRLVHSLAYSQGFYGRLYKEWLDMARINPDEFYDLMCYLEDRKFRNDIDFILFVEADGFPV